MKPRKPVRKTRDARKAVGSDPIRLWNTIVEGTFEDGHPDKARLLVQDPALRRRPPPQKPPAAPQGDSPVDPDSLTPEQVEAMIEEASNVTVEEAEKYLAENGFDVAAERARAEAFLKSLENGTFDTHPQGKGKKTR